MEVEYLVLSLRDALFVLVDPGKRLYWLHLLSAAGIAIIYYRFSSNRRSFSEMTAKAFSRHYWWNRSTQLDYLLFAFNSFLKVVLFAPVLGGQVAVSLTVTKFLHFNVAESHIFFWSPIAISIAFTLAAFLFDDWMRFLVHVCMHRFSVLWRFHKVHHSATTLTPMTVHRTHPVESFINSIRAVLSLGLMSGIFVWLFGHGLQVWDILGVNAMGFLLTLLGANLRHSHVPLHFGRAECLLISPAQHQLHHSMAHSHPNYGSFLAIWDRFNKTWLAGSEAKELRYGLPEPRVDAEEFGTDDLRPISAP